MRVQDPGLSLNLNFRPRHIRNLELERDSRPGTWTPNLGWYDFRPSFIGVSVREVPGILNSGGLHPSSPHSCTRPLPHTPSTPTDFWDLQKGSERWV